MSDEEIEHLLDGFADRVGRIRGKTLSERIEFLRNRYLKTALDSRKEAEAGLDTSNYRSGYASAHETIVEMLVDWDGSADYLESEIISHLFQLLSTEDSNMTPMSYGRIDAYTYMIAELRKAAEETNV